MTPQEYADKWIEISWSSGATDEAAFKAGMVDVYKWHDLPLPEIIFVDTFPEYIDKITKLFGDKEMWKSYCQGQFWVWWPANLDYRMHELKTVEEKDLPLARGMLKACPQVSWFICTDQVVVAVRKPVILKSSEVGDTRVLHALKGPAVQFGQGADAVRYYYVEGVRVTEPSWLENPEAVDPALALTHPNVDQRRALVTILGWDKVLAKVGAKEIAADAFGVLLETTIDGAREKFLKVKCAAPGVARYTYYVDEKETSIEDITQEHITQGRFRAEVRYFDEYGKENDAHTRTFCLPVPREMKTPHQAAAWTYGGDESDYLPEVRT